MKVLDSVAIKLLPIANAIGQQRHLTFLFDLRWG